MIKRIRPSFFLDVSGWDITTAYTILPSTRALSQRVKRTRSLISQEICSVFCTVPGGCEDIHDGFFDFYL